MDTRVFNPSVIFSVMPDLLPYLSVTLLVAVSSIVLGSFLGMVLAWAKLGHHRVLRWLAHGYTYIMRCTPSIVLLFIVFYGLPKLIEADKVKDMDSFAQYSGKLVPIAPQDARYMVIDTYNKEHPDKPIQLQSSEAFQIADAYSWVMEGRYDGYLEVELSYKNNIVKDDAPYHQFNDSLTYIRYKGIPTYPLINKKEQKLADQVDQAIKELRDEGKIAELEQKYFGESLSQYISQ